MFLVYDGQSQFIKDDILSNNSMSSHNDLRGSILDCRQNLALSLGSKPACKQFNCDTERRQLFRHRLIMLLCQYSGRTHNSSLIAILYCRNSKRGSNNSLATSDIALYESLYPLPCHHLSGKSVDGSILIFRKWEWKRLDKGFHHR